MNTFVAGKLYNWHNKGMDAWMKLAQDKIIPTVKYCCLQVQCSHVINIVELNMSAHEFYLLFLRVLSFMSK